MLAYIATQVVAGIAGAAVLVVIPAGRSGLDAVGSGFATNGYGNRSPGGYALITEIVMTAMFLFVILGATDTRAPRGFAPIAIALSLTLIHPRPR